MWHAGDDEDVMEVQCDVCCDCQVTIDDQIVYDGECSVCVPLRTRFGESSLLAISFSSLKFSASGRDGNLLYSQLHQAAKPFFWA